MSERFYWENGVRVPVVDPEYESTPKERAGRPELMTMRALVGLFLEDPDPLTVDCLCLISSLGYDGKSMAEIARKNFVTRATVSNRCVHLCKLLGVPPPRAMRNESSQQKSREARSRKTLEAIKNHLSEYQS